MSVILLGLLSRMNKPSPHKLHRVHMSCCRCLLFCIIRGAVEEQGIKKILCNIFFEQTLYFAFGYGWVQRILWQIWKVIKNFSEMVIRKGFVTFPSILKGDVSNFTHLSTAYVMEGFVLSYLLQRTKYCIKSFLFQHWPFIFLPFLCAQGTYCVH